MEAGSITLVEILDMSATEFVTKHCSNGLCQLLEIVTGKRTYVTESVGINKESYRGYTVVIRLVDKNIRRCWFTDRYKQNKIEITLED